MLSPSSADFESQTVGLNWQPHTLESHYFVKFGERSTAEILNVEQFANDLSPKYYPHFFLSSIYGNAPVSVLQNTLLSEVDRYFQSRFFDCLHNYKELNFEQNLLKFCVEKKTNSFWSDVFNEIDELKNGSELNELLAPASDRAHTVIKNFLESIIDRINFVSKPFVAIDGSGGIVIEWKLGNNYVTLHIDKDDDEMDLIYFNLNQNESYKDLEKSTFIELVSQLFNH